jgi:hypothetical protein
MPACRVRGGVAFMIGMERNADVVKTASYAPTFVNVNDRKWTVDMIPYNNLQDFGTPSYHAISMFSNNRPGKLLPTEVVSKTELPGDQWRNLKGGITLRIWNGQSEFKDLQVVKDGKVLFTDDFSKGLNNWDLKEGAWKADNGVLQNQNTENEAIIGVGDEDWQDRNDTRVDPGRYLERSIETCRWYDIRIEVKNHNLKCFLDGVLIHDEKLKGLFMPSVYAASGISKEQNELIIKIVNPFPEEKRCSFELVKSRSGIWAKRLNIFVRVIRFRF